MISSENKENIKRLGCVIGDNDLLNNVMNSLEKGESKLFESAEVGCVIIKPVFRDGDIGMLVWVAISSSRDAIKTYLPFFENLAKDTDMKFMQFKTKRRGFRRFIKQFNFIESRPSDGFFVFEKEV